MRFAILTSEDEFYRWGCCRTFSLPRDGYRIDEIFLAGSKVWKSAWRDIVRDCADDLFIAVFDLDDDCVTAIAKRGVQVPFWRVVRLLALDDARATILKDRYQEMGVEVDTLENVHAGPVLDFISAEKHKAGFSDIEDGARGLLEYFDMEKPERCGAVVRAVRKAMSGPDCNDHFSLMLTYSRIEAWGCDGWLAAMCDLGLIARKTQNGKSASKRVDVFARKVKLLKDSNEDSVDAVRDCMNAVHVNKVLVLENVIFLRWKYAAELRAGALDLDLMESDIERLKEKELESCATALCMFGAFAGFKAFAEEYHRKMRGRMRRDSQRVTSPSTTIPGTAYATN